MPKVRVPLEEKENRLILANIEYGKKMQGVSDKDLVKSLHITRRTYYNRRHHPEDFKVSELRIISRKLSIPIEDLISFRKISPVR